MIQERCTLYCARESLLRRGKQLPPLRMLCKSDDDLEPDGDDDLLGGVDEAVGAFCR